MEAGDCAPGHSTASSPASLQSSRWMNGRGSSGKGNWKTGLYSLVKKCLRWVWQHHKILWKPRYHASGDNPIRTDWQQTISNYLKTNVWMGLPKEKHALPHKEVSPPSKEVCKLTPSQPSKAVVENAPLIHPSRFKLPGCFRPEDSESLSTGTPVSNIVLKYFIFPFQ